jgi:hypothetical protein
MSEALPFIEKVRGKEPVTYERLTKLFEIADGLIGEYARYVIGIAGGPQKEFEEHKAQFERFQRDLAQVHANIEYARARGEILSATALDNVQFLASHINTMNRILGRAETDTVERLRQS